MSKEAIIQINKSMLKSGLKLSDIGESFIEKRIRDGGIVKNGHGKFVVKVLT